MKYKAIIFDMDGTIIDTEMVWHRAIKSIVEKRNAQFHTIDTHHFLQQSLGMSAHNSCILLKELSTVEDPVELLCEELINNARQNYHHGARFIEGFVPFHDRARLRGLKMGIATNADDHTLSLARQALNLDTLFGSHIYNPTATNNKSKPDRAVYLHAAEQLAVAPHECIAIEDSATGILAARAAGMLCLGIGTSQDKQQTRNAHLQIAGYSDIDLDDLLEI